MINIGLVGVGYWGKNLLRVFNSLHNVRVRYVCDENPAILEQFKENLPLVKFTTDFNQIAEDRSVSAVAIATPVSTHAALAKQLLESDKDMFVEKPLAMNVREAEELIMLAERKNKILMVGHILQYHQAVIRLKHLILKGHLGKIHYIYSNRLNIGKLRLEENILWSFAPHDISVILELVGDEPIKVSAFGGDYLNRGIYDITMTTLEFQNDVKAHIFVSWLHPYKEQRLIVVGSEAMAVVDDLSKEKLLIYPHKIEWVNGKIPVAHKAQYYPVEIGEKEPLIEELEHFIDCVIYRKKPKTDGNEALRVLKVLAQAEQSLRASHKSS